MSRQRTTHPKKPYPDFPLTLHAGSGQWCKKIRGRIVYFGQDADTALKKYLDERDDLQAGRLPRQHSDDAVTVRHVVNHFLTYKKSCVGTGELSPRTFAQYWQGCKLFVEQFGANRLMSDLRPEDFTEYRTVLTKGRGLYDLARQIRIARMVCAYAQDQGLVQKVIRVGKAFREPSRKVLRKNRQEIQTRHGLRMFEAAQLRTILAEAKQPLKAMILLGINCGFGATDCATLPISAVDFKRGWIDFPRPKTGVDRRCPLWDETRKALAEALKARPTAKQKDDSHLFFLTRQGNRWVRSIERKIESVPDGIDDDSSGTLESKKPRLVAFDRVANEFAKVLERLKLKRRTLNFYAIRHTFRTVADEAHDQPAVNFLMGHVDDSMADRYRERISDERLLQVVDHVRKWLRLKNTRSRTFIGERLPQRRAES